MPVFGVVGARGGVGTTLAATNLAVLFSQRGRCMLVDLHNHSGAADLFLGLRGRSSWIDLLDRGGKLQELLQQLAELYPVLVLDVPSANWPVADAALGAADNLLLLTRHDPVAVRNTLRMANALSPRLLSATGLVVNTYAALDRDVTGPGNGDSTGFR